VASAGVEVKRDTWKPYVSRQYRTLPGQSHTDPATGNPFVATRQEEFNIIAASKDTATPLARD
jgi:hypothetical protein